LRGIAGLGQHAVADLGFPVIEETCMKTLTVMTMALSALACACSTVDDPPLGFHDGWRRAQVVGVGDGKATLPLVSKDCRANLERHTSAMRYAVASYSYGGNPNLRRKQIVLVQDDIDLVVGDWLYVNIVDCKLAPQRVAKPSARL
jgi:hypothetical protein